MLLFLKRIMEMSYRNDEDLNFLSELSNEELEPLLNLLIFDKDNKKRFTEQITSDVRYIKNTPNHFAYWDLIAEEYQKFGANSIVSLFRKGKGVTYKEILCDVCDKIKVNYNKKSKTEDIERFLLQKILVESINKMSTDQIKEISDTLELNLVQYTRETAILALNRAINNSVLIFQSFTIIIFASITGKILSRGGVIVATNTFASRLLLFAGPISLCLSSVWTILDIAGPAYRVVIPATVMIACLRQIHNQKNVN